MSKTIQHNELGAIHFKKSKRAKRMRMVVKPFQGVIVTLPQEVTYKQAQEFVEREQAWLKKQLAKARDLEAERTYGFGDEIPTKRTRIKIVKTDKAPYLQQQKDVLMIYLPADEDILAMSWQNLIKQQVEAQLRREAKAYLPARTYEIAQKHNISINKVSVRKARTRWGSCSSQNNISLSIYCMQLPDELIDYIIYHELAHVKEKNHSKQFWDHLEGLLPGAKKLDKQMKDYRTADF